jgi:hypothetical protein
VIKRVAGTTQIKVEKKIYNLKELNNKKKMFLLRGKIKI